MILRTTAAAVTALTIAFGAIGAHASDVLETTAANPNLSMFTKMVETAGIGDELKGEGPFTVFAPSDAAFEQVPDAMLESWMQPENQETLARIVRFHVIPSKVSASDLEGKTSELDTLSEQKMTVDGNSSPIFVEEGAIDTADIEADNGVIHIIDAVVGL